MMRAIATSTSTPHRTRTSARMVGLVCMTVLTVLKVLVDSSRERAPAIIMLRDAVLLSLCRKEEKEWAAVCTGKAGDGHESWSRRRRRSQRERQAPEVKDN